MPPFNAKSPTVKRILQESRELSLNPDPHITAAPLETNLFEWHFTITGPPATPYERGIYHGRIVLPPQYPLRPPAFRFLTPSGRFETNREICLSISGHHEETWQPAWGIRTALCAIRAFMAGDAKGQIGGLDMHPEARERLARESRAWRCAACGGRANDDLMRECEERWREAGGEAPKPDQVPEELRLAFRDEMGKAEHNEEGGAAAAKQPEVAAPPSAPAPAEPERAPSAAQDAPAAAPARPAAALQQRLSAQPEAPAWIDKAIVGVALALVLMFIKRLVGLAEH